MIMRKQKELIKKINKNYFNKKEYKAYIIKIIKNYKVNNIFYHRGTHLLITILYLLIIFYQNYQNRPNDIYFYI